MEDNFIDVKKSSDSVLNWYTVIIGCIAVILLLQFGLSILKANQIVERRPYGVGIAFAGFVGIVAIIYSAIKICNLHTAFSQSPIIKTPQKDDFIKETNDYMTSVTIEFIVLVLLLILVVWASLFKFSISDYGKIISFSSFIAGIVYISKTEGKLQNILWIYYTQPMHEIVEEQKSK